MSKCAISWMVWAAATAAMASVQAQALTDPTRPPGAQLTSPGSPADAQDSAPSGTQLQSVLISSGRKLAVINGTTVPLGGMVGEWKLVKITETDVTLKRADETEVLKLFPGVDKHPSRRGGTDARGMKSARQGGAK